ncbi:MAG: NAD(P)H-binding protein [Planctomycetota bacterium]
MGGPAELGAGDPFAELDPGAGDELAPVSLAAHLASRRGALRSYTAFVLGATGYVGRELVLELRRAGHRTIAHIRPGSAQGALAARFEAAGAEVDHTELTEPALAARLVALAPTHLFLCHGTTRRRGRAEGLADPYEAVDVGLTRLAVGAARDLAEPPRVVYLSSMGAGGRGDYLAARGRAEALVRASGLPFTLCRAPLLTGPDRDEVRPGERAAAALMRPALRVLDALGLRRTASRYFPMDAREAAEGLVRSGFHHMTIDRVVLADELRRVGVYERERWHPRSARDEGRH